MPKMIFVNLPVTDLAASTRFYEAIGCRKNEQFSDDRAASMVWSDTITFQLLQRDYFASFTSKAVADARTKPIGSPDRETAYKAISKMAYEDPHHVFICWAPQMIVARKGIVGIEKTAYIDAAPIPDVRGYGMVAK